MTSNLNLLGTGEALDASLNTIIAEFYTLAEETAVIKPTATGLTLKPGEGRSKNLNNYGRVVASALNDGVDMVQAQALADTTTSYSPAEVGVQVILPGSTLRRSADRQLMTNTSEMLNNAWQSKEDGDGCAQFSSITNGLGAAGTVISPGHLDAMATRLRIGGVRATATGDRPEPAPKPWFGILAPTQANVVRGRIATLGPTANGATAFGVNTGAHVGTTVGLGISPQQWALLQGPDTIGSYAGIMWREDGLVPIDSSDDGIMAAYSRRGLVHVSEVEPRMDPDTTDKSMRGAVEMNLWGSYIWGLYRAGAYLVKGTFDGSLPTS